MKAFSLGIIFNFVFLSMAAQNSLVEDGFGGRLWYKPFNYTVGAYSAYTVCGEEKQLYSWGHNSHCELGDGTSTPSNTPVKVLSMDKVSLYSTGYVMGAIKENGTGWSWGSGINCTPTKVIDDVMFADAGMNSIAFVKTNGEVWSVGASIYGEFGNGVLHNPTSTSPIQMQGITNAVRTAQGQFTNTILLKDGTVWCVGSNLHGGLGDSSAMSNNSISLVPVKAINLKGIIDIKASPRTIIALDSNGNLYSWGGGQQGWLGTGSLQATSVPSKINSLKDIIAISGSNDGLHFLALDKDSNCYAWGTNNWGQCGDGTTNMISVPKKVATGVVDIMAGETFSYIIKEDCSIWCAGQSNVGSIWLNLSNIQRLEFTKIDPSVDSINLCKPVPAIFDSLFINRNDTVVSYPEEFMVFPNAFTPNGDFNNDIFRAIIKPGTTINKFSLQIFNRWGQRVFSTTNILNGWDGLIEGEYAAMDTYFYTANYEMSRKKTFYAHGSIALIR